MIDGGEYGDESKGEGPSKMSPDDLRKLGKKWCERIRAAEKREQYWMDEAEAAEKAYTVDTSSESRGEIPDFNILHSNVETIVPAIYNSTPSPDIRPRHNNRDEAGKLVSDLLERAIAVQIDDSRLDAEIEALAQDAFLAGRGVVRVKFDASEEPQPPMEMMDPNTGEITLMEQPAKVVGERVMFENVSWRDFRCGNAKRLQDLPWVAFRHCLTQEEAEKIDADLFDQQREGESYGDDDFDLDVWEIWCRETQSVYFVTDDGSKVLGVTGDPMGLSGFFPMALPVQPIRATGRIMPICPYTVYKSLAQELDQVTRRIRAITSGLKVVGFVAGPTGDLERLADQEDNTLVPIANLEGIAAVGGIDKAIMWWPVQHAILVLRELYVAREQVKQGIYEITGISDIIRGQGAASETATAQNIKTQWGSLRIKKMQRLIERQVRDLFVITAEIIAMHFSIETLQKMAGIEIPPEAQRLLQKPMDHYRIDVESDSTVRADATSQRQEKAEFLNASAQYFATMAPIAQSAPGAVGPMIEIFASFARSYSLGKSAEDAIEEMVKAAQETAKNPAPNPQQEAAKAAMQMEQDAQASKQKLETERLQFEVEKAKLDVQLKSADLDLRRDDQRLREAEADFNAVKVAAELDMEEDQQRAVKIGDAS